MFDLFQRPTEWEETDRRCQLDATEGPHKLGYTRSPHGKNSMDFPITTSQFNQKQFYSCKLSLQLCLLSHTRTTVCSYMYNTLLKCVNLLLFTDAATMQTFAELSQAMWFKIKVYRSRADGTTVSVCLGRPWSSWGTRGCSAWWSHGATSECTSWLWHGELHFILN